MGKSDEESDSGGSSDVTDDKRESKKKKKSSSSSQRRHKSRRSDSDSDSGSRRPRRHRRSKKSDSSESESDDDARREKRVRRKRTAEEQAQREEEKKRRKLEKKAQLIMQKKLERLRETPEERKRRKEEKRLRKERQKREEMAIFGGFTDDSNPWGDPSLTKPFQWKKKVEKLREQGLDPSSVTEEELLQQRRELVAELDKLHKATKKRQEERQAFEEEKARLAREREWAAGAGWEREQEEFRLRQAKQGSEIRLLENRPRPIDLLYKNILIVEKPELEKLLAVEIREPYLMFDELSVQDLEDVREQIAMRVELGDSYADYWVALLTCCDEALQRALRNREIEKFNATAAPGDELRPDISAEVDRQFEGKDFDALCEMERHMKSRIRAADTDESIDVEYWERLLKRVELFKARAKLEEMHSRILRAHLSTLEKMRAEELAAGAASITTAAAAAAAAAIPTATPSMTLAPASASVAADTSGAVDSAIADLERELGRGASAVAPPPAASAGPSSASAAIAAAQAAVARTAAAAAQKAKKRDLEELAQALERTDDEMYAIEASKSMEDGEAMFTEEVPVDDKVYSWFDKYRPRKPRYFNRIHTAFDWNKYNQTHYDHDNPPPKTVSGYKFNIFYPDLIDKTKTPTFQVLRDTGDTCILRFHAGPPYEDVAFRIANKEWDHSAKHGFRNTFDRGVLQLYFHFKRHRYRR